MKRGRPVDDGTFWYIDAVEEAMCFGWIDSTTKKLADGGDGTEAVPEKDAQQLVGTEQGKMSQDGTARADDRCRQSRVAGYDRQGLCDRR